MKVITRETMKLFIFHNEHIAFGIGARHVGDTFVGVIAGSVREARQIANFPAEDARLVKIVGLARLRRRKVFKLESGDLGW